MDAHTHEEIKLYGSFTVALTISREPKDPIDLERLLEAALIDQMPQEWLAYLQEEYNCNDIQETASVIISWDTIKSTPLPNEPLIYEVVLPKDDWMIEAAAKAHEQFMNKYYRLIQGVENAL
tara:strand:+ start:475 stop:840 length:366 start_codon:yes stop_codon:yes gene_type:complete